MERKTYNARNKNKVHTRYAMPMANRHFTAFINVRPNHGVCVLAHPKWSWGRAQTMETDFWTENPMHSPHTHTDSRQTNFLGVYTKFQITQANTRTRIHMDLSLCVCMLNVEHIYIIYIEWCGTDRRQTMGLGCVTVTVCVYMWMWCDRMCYREYTGEGDRGINSREVAESNQPFGFVWYGTHLLQHTHSPRSHTAIHHNWWMWFFFSLFFSRCCSVGWTFRNSFTRCSL